MKIGALAIALAFAAPPLATAQAPEPVPSGVEGPVPSGVEGPVPSGVEGRIVEIRVHGNHTTPDADVLAIAGLTVGEVATPERLAEAESRLLASRRFTAIEVRRRYQSIADPSRILVVLLVDELPGVSKDDLIPGPFARLRHVAMWLPILSFADGYGFTYGARVSVVNTFGSRSRVSTPLTWGGERRAAVEVERAFDSGLLSVARGTVAVHRSVNPHFHLSDTRREVRFEADRALTSWLRVGGDARTTQITFGQTDARHQAAGGHIIVDTRLDPSFPRNGALASLAWERVGFQGGSSGRWSTDLRGYVGLLRGSVLALRAHTVRASAALPPSEQTLLGGSDSLRGYRAGYRAGDGIAATSAEVRVPLTSPLRIGRFGTKVFLDAGTTWPAGMPLTKQRFEHGAGGGIYFGVAALTAGLDVAWPDRGRGRWHFGLGLSF
jgi:outer membrane protein assembly factor BamA